jgi:hypothetical protein
LLFPPPTALSPPDELAKKPGRMRESLPPAAGSAAHPIMRLDELLPHRWAEQSAWFSLPFGKTRYCRQTVFM